MKEINFEIKIPKIRFSGVLRGRLKMIFSVLVVAGAFFAKQNFDFTLFGTFILIYFGVSILWNLSSRIPAVFALLFLASCPVLLILKKDALAETFAVYAYYFLVIAVVNEILALRKKDSETNLSTRQAISE